MMKQNNNGEVTELFSEIRDARKRMFLIDYCQSGSIEQASKSAGVGRVTTWYWRRDDKEFTKAFDVADRIYHDNYLSQLERELKKRSLDKSAPMSTVALFFALKAEAPDKYREKVPEQREIGPIKVILEIPDRRYPQLEEPKGEDNAAE